jgi:hypothetical protein
VLNLSIAMRANFFAFGWIFLHWFVQAITPSPEPVSITTPETGAALQGQILIKGSTDVPGFQMAEIWYSYDGGTGSFLISQQREAVQDGELGIWDTTTISDGNYELHLKIFLTDGSVQEYVVDGLRVRNSSPIETNTPPIEVLPANITPTQLLPTTTVRPTSTWLPPNPASITNMNLGEEFVLGGLIVAGVFVALGLYLGIRKLLHRP